MARSGKDEWMRAVRKSTALTAMSRNLSAAKVLSVNVNARSNIKVGAQEFETRMGFEEPRSNLLELSPLRF